jgi:hypothetical protein
MPSTMEHCAKQCHELHIEVNRLRAALEEVAVAAENNQYLSPVMVAKICRRALAALETSSETQA